MSDQFLHGIEFVGIDYGARVIETPRAGVIGLVGTAPAADNTRLPLNTPAMLNTALRSDVAAVGASGTLAKAINIYHRSGYTAFVVVVRVAEGVDAAATRANIIEGIQLLKGAESITKVKPRINIAPWFSHESAVANELASVCDATRAISFVDAPDLADSTYADAITYGQGFSNRRVNVCWPSVKVFDTTTKDYEDIPLSLVAAGLEAGTDYWKSSSNKVAPLVSGTSKPIHFELSQAATTANLLNEKGITTVVHQNGYRLWGARNASDDQMWRYRNHVRLDDMVAEALIQSHLWAVDRNITKTYVDEVTEGVNNYLRYLASPAVEAIAGGKCWADPEINTTDMMEAGRVFFDFDYGRFGVAEHITFRRLLNQSYVEEVFK
jgi:hypothetical protein